MIFLQAKAVRSNLSPSSPTLSEKDASVYIGLTPAYLKKARYLGDRGPAYLQLGRTIRYRVADLDAWLLKHRVEIREDAS